MKEGLFAKPFSDCCFSFKKFNISFLNFLKHLHSVHSVWNPWHTNAFFKLSYLKNTTASSLPARPQPIIDEFTKRPPFSLEYSQAIFSDESKQKMFFMVKFGKVFNGERSTCTKFGLLVQPDSEKIKKIITNIILRVCISPHSLQARNKKFVKDNHFYYAIVGLKVNTNIRICFSKSSKV